VEPLDPTSHRLTVLRVRESNIALLSTQVYTAIDVGGPVTDAWRELLSLANQPTGEALLAHREWPDYQRGNIAGFRWTPATAQLQETGPGAGDAAWLAGSPQPIGFDPNGPLLAPYVWRIMGDDRIMRARLGLGATGDQLVLTSPDRPDTAVLRGADLRMVWRSARAIPAGVTPRDWARRVDDRLVAADLDGDGLQELLLLAATVPELALAGRTPEQGLALRWATSAIVRPPGGGSGGGWPITGGAQLLVGDLDGDGCEEVVSLQSGMLAILRGLPPRRTAFDLGVRDRYGPSSALLCCVVVWAFAGVACAGHDSEQLL
jgi:hypothetical protein